MLEKLLTLETMEDMTAFGLTLLNRKAFAELQSDILGSRIVFKTENYWTEDKLLRYTATEKDLQDTIKCVAAEPIENRALHMLQLLKQLCPAVAPVVTRFLQRTTC